MKYNKFLITVAIITLFIFTTNNIVYAKDKNSSTQHAFQWYPDEENNKLNLSFNILRQDLISTEGNNGKSSNKDSKFTMIVDTEYGPRELHFIYNGDNQSTTANIYDEYNKIIWQGPADIEKIQGNQYGVTVGLPFDTLVGNYQSGFELTFTPEGKDKSEGVLISTAPISTSYISIPLFLILFAYLFINKKSFAKGNLI